MVEAEQIVDASANPFRNLMDELNQTQAAAEKSYMESEPKDPQIYDQWAASSIRAIAERSLSKETKIELIKDLMNMLQASYCLNQPQEQQEEHKDCKKAEELEKKLQEVQVLHQKIVNQIPEVLSAYLHQKLNLDMIVNSTQTWIEEQSKQFGQAQEVLKKMNETLTMRGMNNVPSNRLNKHFEDLIAEKDDYVLKIYEENLILSRDSFYQKQNFIETNLNQIMVKLSLDYKAKQFKEIRDLLIFTNTYQGSVKNSFRFKSLEDEIQSIKFQISDNGDFSGFKLSLKNGKQSEQLGSQNRKAIDSQLLIPSNLKAIRIKKRDGIYTYLEEITTVQEDGTQSSTQSRVSEDPLESQQFILQKHEQIIGVYGETYNEANERLKSFGFIIGTYN